MSRSSACENASMVPTPGHKETRLPDSSCIELCARSSYNPLHKYLVNSSSRLLPFLCRGEVQQLVERQTANAPSRAVYRVVRCCSSNSAIALM
eukprot:1389894-Amphidinium_carterae.1